MSRAFLWALFLAIVWAIVDGGKPPGPTATESSVDLPTTCRECDDAERTFNTFRCPSCHPGMSEEDHPQLVTDWRDENAS